MAIVDEKEQWWRPEYLFNAVQKDIARYSASSSSLNSAQRRKQQEATAVERAKTLARLIIASKRYSAIATWHSYYKKQISLVQPRPESQNQAELALVVQQFKQELILIHSTISSERGKILVGTKSPKNPLWLDKKAVMGMAYSSQDEQASIIVATEYIISNLEHFTGDMPQAHYDRLLFPPAAQDWPAASDWSVETIKWFEAIIAKTEPLGIPSGKIEEDEYAQILTEAYLNQAYSLVEGRPVLVRLDGHPVVHQVILMQKGDLVFTRIETHRHRQLLHNFSLSSLKTYDSTLDYFKALRGIVMDDNLALTALVAAIYRDLVIVEETQTSHPFQNKQVKKKRHTRLAPTSPADKPALFTTVWQYIPRRRVKTFAVTSSLDGDNLPTMTNERKPLEASESNHRARLRHWHMVRGHIRAYQGKADWQATSERQDLADAVGIKLSPGQTYVRPHARNADILTEMVEAGEINLENIPHYLRLPKKPK